MYSVDVPTFEGKIQIKFETGKSVVFIGANGAGKTRLGVYIDDLLSRSSANVHRIAAHRSLVLNPEISPPSLEIATNRLLFGYDRGTYAHKKSHRFGDRPETVLLTDFDHVLSSLYAENNDISIEYRTQSVHGQEFIKPPLAKIDKLKSIWDNILPHRELVILSNNLKVKDKNGINYSASDMSDGERVYFI